MSAPSFQNCLNWFSSDNLPKDDNHHLSQTRDLFQARLGQFVQELIGGFKIQEQDAFLLSAIIGEVGNNSFDHNLGQWKDIPGCWLEYASTDTYIDVYIADRGQGIRASLQHVKPDIESDNEALTIAFTKRLSGRAPEKRGNGLKFVRDIINDNPQRGLLCASGSGIISFGGIKKELNDLLSHSSPIKGPGVFTFIRWKKVSS